QGVVALCPKNLQVRSPAPFILMRGWAHARVVCRVIIVGWWGGPAGPPHQHGRNYVATERSVAAGRGVGGFSGSGGWGAGAKSHVIERGEGVFGGGGGGGRG